MSAIRAALTIILIVLSAGLVSAAEQEPKVTIDIAGHPFTGPANAPVTVVVFSDYLRGGCKRLEPLLQQVLEKYPKEVKLVHKFVPAHDFTWKAATAALAANEQGKFWQFHDQLFENQGVLDEEKLFEIAEALKLDMECFRKKMEGPTVMELISWDFDDTKDLGIPATPWVYVNGRHLVNRSLSGFIIAIDKELGK